MYKLCEKSLQEQLDDISNDIRKMYELNMRCFLLGCGVPEESLPPLLRNIPNVLGSKVNESILQDAND